MSCFKCRNTDQISKYTDTANAWYPPSVYIKGNDLLQTVRRTTSITYI